MEIESIRWFKSQLKHKVSITKGLLIAFMITGTVMSYSEGTEEIASSNQSSRGGVNVTINNYGEQTGLELGDNSRARGIGSVSTGRNGIAVGNNAVATGENETKETIERKLEENRQKLQEIADAKKVIADKAEELRLKQITERETIEAGIRVEEINKAKEKAKKDWQNKLNTYNTEKENSRALLEDYNNKINDLNSRLNAVKNLGSFDIKSDQGLEAAAVKLKEKVEEGTNLRLETSFYKDYIVNHYKVLGDLRVNELIWSKSRGNSAGLTFKNYKLLKTNNALKKDLTDLIIPNLSPKTSSYAASSDTASSYSHPYTYESGSSSSSYYSTSYSSASGAPGGWEYNVLGGYTLQKIGDTGLEGLYSKGEDDNEWVTDTIYDIEGVKINTYVNIEVDLTDKENYDKWVSVKDKWKNKIHEYNARLGDQFLGKVDTLTGGKSTEYYNMVTDLKFELVDLDKQITYYQWEYEKEKDNNPIKANEWLDKKNEALKIRKDRIDNNSKKLFEKGKELGFYTGEYNINTVRNGIDYMIGEKYYGKWKKENIDDPKEKNKISINTLTSELERELNINKEEVIKKEKELETLLKESNQAEINYNSINPNESDVVLAKKYEKVKAEIEKLTADLNEADTRLTNLKNALTLNDLKNIGENQIAFGTETLAVGNNSIAMGYKSITVGTDSVNIGARGQATGTSITQLGQDLVTNGNNNISIGNTNVINGENNIVFGRNNKIGALGDDNKSNGNVVLGSGITVSKDVTNSITLGDNSTPISNAISVGKAGTERQIKNVKDATDDQDAVTYKQLKDKADNNLSNITDKETARTNLDVYSKGEVDGKLNNKLDSSALTNDLISSKLEKGNVTSETLTITNGNNRVLGTDELKIELKNKSITKDKLTDELKTEIEGKANASDLNSYVKTDGTNIDATAKTALTNKLTEGANLDNPTGTIVTDTIVKTKLDSLNTDLGTKLDNKANKDLSNVENNTIINKVATGNLDTPTGALVTDTKIKEKLDLKADKSTVYTKDEVDTKLNSKANATDLDSLAKKDLTNVTKDTIINKVGNGNLDTPTGDLVKDTVIKAKLDSLNTDLGTKLDNKANKDLSNVTDKETARTNLDVYSKGEVDGKLNNKLDSSALTNDLISSKLEKGNVTSETLTITNGNNRVLGTDELKIELKNKSITKDKLTDELKTEIEGKANASDLNSYVKTDGTNIDATAKTALTNKLTEGANLDNPTGTIVTDTIVKAGFDKKLNKDLSNLEDTEKDTLRTNLDVYKKSEVDSKLNGKANKDASNIDVTKFTTKLNENANISTPKDKLVTDRNVKEYLDTNYYNKKDLDDKVGGVLNSHLLPGSIGDPNDKDKTYLVTDKQVKEYVDKESSRYNTLSSAGVANAIATASLPQVSNNYTFGLSAAVGHYNGQNAFAVGISGQSDNGRFIYKIGSALNTKSKFSIGVGATVLFGEIVKPNVMNAKENKELREKNSDLESKVEKLEQTVKELLKDKETEKIDKSAENEKLIQSLLDKIKELSSKVEILDLKTKKVK